MNERRKIDEKKNSGNIFISNNDYVRNLTKYPPTFSTGDLINSSDGITINGNTQYIFYTSNQAESIEEECYYSYTNSSIGELMSDAVSKLFNIILLTRFIRDDELKVLLIYMKRVILFRIIFISRCNYYVPFVGDVCNERLVTFLEGRAKSYYDMEAETHIYNYLNDAFYYYYTILHRNLKDFDEYWLGLDER